MKTPFSAWLFAKTSDPALFAIFFVIIMSFYLCASV